MWIRKEKGERKKEKRKEKRGRRGEDYEAKCEFFFVYFTFYPINSSPRTCSKSILSVSPPTAIMFSAAVRPRRAAAIQTFGAAFAASGNASRCAQVPSNSTTTHHRSCSGRPSRCLPSLPRLSRPLRSTPPRSRRCSTTSVLTSYERAHVVERRAPAISGPARSTRLASRHASSPAACRGVNAADWRAENTVRNAAVSVIPPVTMRAELDAHDRVVHVECRPRSRRSRRVPPTVAVA